MSCSKGKGPHPHINIQNTTIYMQTHECRVILKSKLMYSLDLALAIKSLQLVKSLGFWQLIQSTLYSQITSPKTPEFVETWQFVITPLNRHWNGNGHIITRSNTHMSMLAQELDKSYIGMFLTKTGGVESGLSMNLGHPTHLLKELETRMSELF